MGARRNAKNDQIVRAILAYMEEHFQEDITVPDMAKRAGYSVTWMGKFFRRQTGLCPSACLLRIRMNRSKDLLLNSDLTVTEISANVGFSSYNRFSIAFKKSTGMTPTEFRNRASALGEAPVSILPQSMPGSDSAKEQFRDRFNGKELKSCWKADAGQWTQNNGELIGSGGEGLSLLYTDLLPENFQLEFELCSMDNPHWSISLHGDNVLDLYMTASLGQNLNGLGEFRFAGNRNFWRHYPKISAGAWHKMQLEVTDDKVKFLLNGNELMFFKDPFPPEYPARCHFGIGGWQTSLKIRDVVIRDYGFSPMVRSIRRADALYRNGIFDRALENYMRLLGATTAQTEIPELHYKIGMCYLQQKAYTQSQAWLSKVTAAPGDSFWLHAAQHALLDQLRQQREFPWFLEKAQSMFSVLIDRDSVRTCMESAIYELMNQGFFEQALSCLRTLHDLEPANSLFSVLAKGQFCDLLFNLRQYTEAGTHLRTIIETCNPPKPLLLQSLLNLADVLSYSGDFPGSESTLEQVRTQTRQQYYLLRCDMLQAANLRGQERFKDAASVLIRAYEDRAEASSLGVYAALMAANILCQTGRTLEASNLIRDLENRFPGNLNLQGFPGSSFKYPPLLLESSFAEAGDVLLQGVNRGERQYQSASQMVRAGILFELASDGDKARSVWSEVTRRFRLDRCCFFADLSFSLLGEKEDILRTMPYRAFDRAEMFYLAGLLYRKRNESDKARKYFRLAVDDDPTLNWFTWLAKKETGL